MQFFVNKIYGLEIISLKYIPCIDKDNVQTKTMYRQRQCIDNIVYTMYRQYGQRHIFVMRRIVYDATFVRAYLTDITR